MKTTLQLERIWKEELSPSEDKMAQLYSVGFEKKEIANMLCRSYSTIVNTLRKVYEKLKVRNRSELSIQFVKKKFKILVEVSSLR